MLTTNIGYHTIITDLEYNVQDGVMEAVTGIWWRGEFQYVRWGDPRFINQQHQEQVDYITWLEGITNVEVQ